jgi:hypothetical protein
MKKRKPESLNEELSRMKSLMNFKMEDNSHKRLSEEFISNSTKKRKVVSEQKTLPMEAKKEATWVQDNYGNNIFSRSMGKPQPLKVEPPKVEARYEDNMVTIDGAKNPDQLRQQLDKVIFNLTNTPGFDAKNVVMFVQGAANDKEPTGAGPGGRKLDHPEPPYGGIDISKEVNHDAGNLYLAQNRAKSVAGYIEEKIPGLTIKTSGKVMPGKTEEEKFILLSAKYKDEAEYPQETGEMKLEFINGLRVELAKNLGVEGSEIGQKGDQRYAGGRYQTPVQFGYTWHGGMGENPQAAKGQGTQGEQRKGTWTDIREGGAVNNAVSGAWVRTVLTTSGYLNNASEADTIMRMIQDGENKTIEGITKITDIGTFLKTLGVGNSTQDINLAVRNGAYLFDYIDGRVKGGKKQT